MKYKVTTKCGLCQILGQCYCNIYDCLSCIDSVVLDKTEEYTQEEYLNLLKMGNVYIIKVEVI